MTSWTDEAPDLLLSSGFLAFARHAGVAAALQQRGIRPAAIVGTSSGSVVGALLAAGYDADAIAGALRGRRPIGLMRPHLRPWRGLARLDPFVALMRSLLPARFDQLQIPLAVGVIRPDGSHALLDRGDLPQAVVASCAMSHVFAPIAIDGVAYADGGAADRLALAPWRSWRPGRSAIAHEVARTAGRDVDGDRSGVVTIRTPRSGASFLSLGDFDGQLRQARDLALAALDAAATRDATAR